jgi:5'-nucleotidase
MNTLKPLILVTNDDGVSAPGLEPIAVMAEIGDVLVVAQTSPKAVWVCITTNSTLYLNKISKENDVIEEYSCSEPR